ncbi:hypothetical protein LWI28_027701 [Acer negundo]|uniref:Uncharacterized protein n=1 Tax=Acer negundo TaxID=4023 RepID=A0AAD5P0I3_ACENE|nr:hypothetical protein LWI28_027701 [Acer negundo]
MVNYLLMICADLENLTNLEPHDGCDDPNFSYLFKVKCGCCGELSQKETCVSLGDTVPNSSEREPPISSKNASFVGGMELGFEPVDFIFGDGWKVESIAGTKYEGVDLSGEDFAEYDEKGECPVMISNLRSKFDVVK